MSSTRQLSGSLTKSAVPSRRRTGPLAIYKPLLGKKPGPGWVRTAERFVDPESGKMVDVFYEPSSGERQHVSQDPETANKPR